MPFTLSPFTARPGEPGAEAPSGDLNERCLLPPGWPRRPGMPGTWG